ncbi:MAG: hypothetical protein D6790_09840, partial [Caldilineae bacterium]
MSVQPGVSSRVEAGVSMEHQTGWRRNPERVAWVILLTAFALFIILSVSIPLAVRYVINYASVPMAARFEPTVGTVLLYPPKGGEPIAITAPKDEIPQGSQLVTTGEGTQGVLGLAADPESPDQLGAVHLYPGTTLELVRIQQPRFRASNQPYRMRLTLHEGRIRLFTNSGEERPLEVWVSTPHGRALLQEGSYTFTVTPERTDVSVSQGQAQLMDAQERTVVVGPGLRTWVTATDPPQEPVSAERNLIRSGDFSQPLLEHWETYSEAPYVSPGTVDVEEQDGRRVAHFIRQGEDGVHTEVGIRQRIDQDVNGYDYLSIRLDVKLIRQTLRGAGEKSSEFPLRFEIAYTDIYGKDLTWGWGFYYRDPPPDWPLVGGEKIAPFVWYSYESPNLMELLADTRPARINSIRVYASGWN